MLSRSTGLREVAPNVSAEVGTVEHQGREYSAGGAYVDDYRIVGYLPCGADDGRFGRGEFTAWDGSIIGRYEVLSTWRTPRSWLSSHQVSALVTLRDGRKYIVRGGGAGLLMRGRRASCQLRPIRRQSRSF